VLWVIAKLVARQQYMNGSRAIWPAGIGEIDGKVRK